MTFLNNIHVLVSGRYLQKSTTKWGDFYFLLTILRSSANCPVEETWVLNRSNDTLKCSSKNMIPFLIVILQILWCDWAIRHFEYIMLRFIWWLSSGVSYACYHILEANGVFFYLATCVLLKELCWSNLLLHAGVLTIAPCATLMKANKLETSLSMD